MTSIDQLDKDDFFAKAHDLLLLKSNDYSGGDNIFANFERAEMISGVSVERQLVLRMADKLGRISRLIDSENEVKDETIEDTLTDMANYAFLLAVRLR